MYETVSFEPPHLVLILSGFCLWHRKMTTNHLRAFSLMERGARNFFDGHEKDGWPPRWTEASAHWRRQGQAPALRNFVSR